MAKVILISGGSDGLGKEIARLLIKANTVVLLAPTAEKTAAVAKELGCDFEVCDITKWDQIEKAVSSIIKKYDHIDILINNAGIWIEGPLEQNDPARIHQVLEINTLGTIWLTRASLPHMESGIIINIVSVAGLETKPNRSVYYASKWAITGFTKCLREELAEKGIKVIGIYPPKMQTGIFKKAGNNKDLSDGLDPKVVAKTITDYINSNFENTSPDITFE